MYPTHDVGIFFREQYECTRSPNAERVIVRHLQPLERENTELWLVIALDDDREVYPALGVQPRNALGSQLDDVGPI